MSLEENGASGNPGRASSGIQPLAPPSPHIGLWWCSLEPLPTRLDAFERSLSTAERARAARFGTVQLRDRYVMGRGSLRWILAGELGSLCSLATVLEVEQAADHLLFASFFHALSFWINRHVGRRPDQGQLPS